MSDPLELVDDWGPEKVVCVSDARTGMRGVLVVDNTARGMGKGGTRMCADLSVAEVARLARVMTLKWAVADLYFGGAKAGIQGDPADPRRESWLRAFARALENEVPAEYVFGLDVGLSEGDAAILCDELGDRSAAVGLPAALGGLPYDALGVTGFGVAEAADMGIELAGLSMARTRVSIQGFGAVGSAVARRLSELGATVVAVSTSHGAVHEPDGLDVEKLLALGEQSGDACVTEYRSGTQLERGAELHVDTDVFIPAATQDVLDEAACATLPARLVVEGANMASTQRGRATLASRDVTVVPDVVANAGGAIAAAHSMDAPRSGFRHDPAPVFRAVSQKVRENTTAVLSRCSADGTTAHEASFAIASERIARAMQLRGRSPVSHP